MTEVPGKGSEKPNSSKKTPDLWDMDMLRVTDRIGDVFRQKHPEFVVQHGQPIPSMISHPAYPNCVLYSCGQRVLRLDLSNGKTETLVLTDGDSEASHIQRIRLSPSGRLLAIQGSDFPHSIAIGECGGEIRGIAEVKINWSDWNHCADYEDFRFLTEEFLVVQKRTAYDWRGDGEVAVLNAKGEELVSVRGYDNSDQTIATCDMIQPLIQRTLPPPDSFDHQHIKPTLLSHFPLLFERKTYRSQDYFGFRGHPIVHSANGEAYAQIHSHGIHISDRKGAKMRSIVTDYLKDSVLTNGALSQDRLALAVHGNVQVWDASPGRIASDIEVTSDFRRTIECDAPLESFRVAERPKHTHLAFADEGRTLISSGDDGMLKVWRLST